MSVRAQFRFPTFTCRLSLVACCLLLVAYPCLFAVDIHPDAGTTSAAFLKLGVGARATAMGGAFCAVADDVTALYWNPAGLAQLERAEFHVTHQESFESIRHDFAGYARPLGSGALGVALYGLSVPKDLERRSGLNESDPYEPLSPVEGYFGAADYALHVSYARMVRPRLAAGASLKFIRQTIDTYAAHGAAADLGVLYRLAHAPVALGLAVQHAGTPVKFIERSYQLPLTVRAGAAWRPGDRLTAALDLAKPVDNFLSASAGGEYRLLEMLALRLGYRYRWHGLELGDLSGLSAGIGFAHRFPGLDIRLDYAFMPFGVLGNAHRVSFGVQFAAPERPRSVRVGRKTAKKQTPSTPTAAAEATPAAPQFTYHPVTLTTRLKVATGRMAVYGVEGRCLDRDVRGFQGNLKTLAPGAVRMEIGERPGTGKVYKHFDFRSTSPVPVANAVVELNLPAGIERPVIVTPGDRELVPERIAEADGRSTYRCSFDILVPFRVELR